MDLRWIAPALAIVVIGTLWLPVGSKDVHAVSCTGNWESYHCDHTHWEAEYELLRLDIDTRTYQSDDRAPLDGGDVEAWRWPYSDEAAPHGDAMYPLLLAAGPLILLGGAMVVPAGYVWLALPQRATHLIYGLSWGMFATGCTAFLAGMSYHAFTWRGYEVDPWLPGWGLPLVVLAMASGYPLIPRVQGDPLPALPSKVM